MARATWLIVVCCVAATSQIRMAWAAEAWWDFFGPPLGASARQLPKDARKTACPPVGGCAWVRPGETYAIYGEQIIDKALVREHGHFRHPLPTGLSPDDGPEQVEKWMRAKGLDFEWQDTGRSRLVSSAIPWGQSDGVFLYFEFGPSGRLSLIGVALNEAV